MITKNCNCGAKTAKDQIEYRSSPAVKKLLVSCPMCETALVGEDGMVYPLHVTRAIVTQAQFEAWLAAGYGVVEVTSP